METLLELYDEMCERASLGEKIRIPQRLKSVAENTSADQLKRFASTLESDMDHIPGSENNRVIQAKIADLALVAYYIFQQRTHEETEEPQIH